jgi:pimeloyl-ACP methyl ester carboxylesterase
LAGLDEARPNADSSLGVTLANFVLVHGAFEGGFCFQRVAHRLRQAGHEVWTPTLTGAGERFHLLTREVGLETHVQDIVSVLEYEDLRDVSLVGHSYGGTVVTAAADRAFARIARVIYLDASAPQNGQSASGAFTEGTEDVLNAMAEADEDWLLPPLPLSAVGVTAPDDVAMLEARRHPHPMRTLREPVHLSGHVDSIPRAYIVCSQHQGLSALFGVDPLAAFVERARHEGWPLQVLDAPHDAMITHPDLVASALLSYVE